MLLKDQRQTHAQKICRTCITVLTIGQWPPVLADYNVRQTPAPKTLSVRRQKL